jgi:glycosyltransferase involved in cell wall biosynthesis
MPLPKVSIVIPSYEPEYFEQCLRSAIGQTDPDIDILVGDNCPTEEIREIRVRYPMTVYRRNTATRAQNVHSAMYGAMDDFIKPLIFPTSQVIDAANRRLEARRPYETSGSMTGLEPRAHGVYLRPSGVFGQIAPSYQRYPHYLPSLRD